MEDRTWEDCFKELEEFAETYNNSKKKKKLKYTLIYAESFQVGSHRSAFTKMAYIEADTEEEMKEIVEEEYGWGSVFFLFKGHCEHA